MSQCAGEGLYEWEISLSNSGGGTEFLSFRNVQTGSGAHPASYIMAAVGLVFKGYGSQGVTLRMRGLYFHSPYVFWRRV